MLKELPKIGDKVRYLGGGKYEEGLLVVGNIYEVIDEDIREEDSDVTFKTGDKNGDEWYIYGADHSSGSDLHKYELVEEGSDAVNQPPHYTRGKFETIALSASYPKYFKDVSDIDSIDVYKTHELFGIDDPSGAIQHASKKLLLSGVRTGGKSKFTDIKEARDTLNRWLEINAMEAETSE